MTTARQENVRTLAAAIGAGEEDSERLLDATVLITCTPGGMRLAGHIEALLSRTLSHATQEFTSEVSVEIVVGQAIPRSQARVVNVGVDTDRLEVSAEAIELGATARPIVELIAACYATAAAVSIALGVELPVPLLLPINVDLAELYGAATGRLDGPIDLGPCFMAGAGAIGNAVLAGLSMFDVQGELRICDPDTTSDGNLNRCWWFGAADLELPKADRLVLRAQPCLPNLRLISHVATLHDAVERCGGRPPETLIVGVDSPRARRMLQNEMPRRVYDASTSGIVEFVLHFNEIPSTRACMSCIYYEAPDESAHEVHIADGLGVTVADVRTNFITPSAALAIARTYPELTPSAIEGFAYDSLFKQLCGKGQLKTGTADRVLAPFGFVSVLAGVMLAVEIAIRTAANDSQPDYNYWRLSPWGSPVVRMRETRPKRTDCEFCSDETLKAVVEKLWG